MKNKSKYSLSFSVRASKVHKAGKAPIEVTLLAGEERMVFSTGKLVLIDNWNKEKQMIRDTSSESVELND